MFSTPTPDDFAAAERASRENPITAAAIKSAVSITQRVLVTLLEEHGVDVSKLQPTDLAAHIQTITTANSAAGMATVYQDLKKIPEGKSSAQPVLTLLKTLMPERADAMMEGIEVALEVTRIKSLAMAENTKAKMLAFTEEHPSPFFDALGETKEAGDA
jgi:hypothetical protein